MLREGKAWHFTLREVARRAGVSHAAPYKHFSDKAALLAELALQGYRQLQEDLITAILPVGGSPHSELIALAKAYLDFGRANPSLFELMFSSEIDKSGDASLKEASCAPVLIIADILTRGQRARLFKRAPVEVRLPRYGRLFTD
ncbi:TetR/AcrR family transcriptional regulator [Hyphomicrobium sp. 99]|uniref:TetR/AcrR family transcriptional regulator n=1 Tax=Hyphomicrobium sp. 99 TaxID=1163419 RepID=UPI001FD8D80C|nr:TetR/AcrR family transcriptional regulator [Hyphomicrobium sp. 99]